MDFWSDDNFPELGWVEGFHSVWVEPYWYETGWIDTEIPGDDENPTRIIFHQGMSAATIHYLRLLREDEEATAAIMAFLEAA